MLQEIKTIENQTIFDIVVSTYVDLGQTFKFVRDNNIGGINDTDLSGKTYIFDSINILDVGFVRSLKTKISTGQKSTVQQSNYRITEIGDRRITEAGDPRIIE